MLAINKHNKKNSIVVIIMLVICVSLGIAYFITHQKSPSIKIQDGSNAVSNPKVPGSTSNQSISGSSNNGGVIDKQRTNSTTPTITPSTTPKAPLGTFVSNHTPGQNTQSEVSTCTTTPGAGCQIIFTNQGLVKTVPIQIADSDGNTQWNWTPQDISLSTGVWQVSANAKNGALISTSNDATPLRIQ